MTETSILPTADVGSTAPGDPTPLFDEEPGDDRRRLMIIGGIVVGVLVLLIGYLLLKGGGSSDDSLGAVPRGTPHAVSSPAGSGDDGSGDQGSKTDGTQAGAKLPKPSNRQLAKDPFKPLVVDPKTAKGGSSAASGAGAGTGASATMPTGKPVSVRFVKVVTDDAGKPLAEFVVTFAGPHAVATFDEAPPVAGSTKGTVFANVFSLLGIQGNVVTLQIGDDTPFDLRTGASHAV